MLDKILTVIYSDNISVCQNTPIIPVIIAIRSVIMHNIADMINLHLYFIFAASCAFFQVFCNYQAFC